MRLSPGPSSRGPAIPGRGNRSRKEAEAEDAGTRRKRKPALAQAVNTGKEKRMPHSESAPAQTGFDVRFFRLALGLLLTAVLFFTFLHTFLPGVLRVPRNRDPSSWVSPTLEQTCIYERMTEAEKEKLRRDGVPGGVGEILLYEALSLFGAWLCFVHARRHYGLWMATCFLIGSFVYTGVEESMMIMTGRLIGGGKVDPTVFGTYWFPKGALWFIETPVWVCLCWFLIAYSCVWVAGKVFPRMNLVGRAAVGGLIAMGIDLWEDPVLTSPEILNWIWGKGDHLRILGIPHGNFLGWFFLILVFALIWEALPKMEKRWTRARASLLFVLVLPIGDLAVYAILVTWGTFVNNVILPQGFAFPPGW